jgi:hypothetical protein
MKQFVIYIFLSLLVFSCDTQKNRKLKSEIRLERWTVTGDSSSYERDEIQYLETTLFNEKEEEKAIAYYDKNKQLTATEEKLFHKETRQLIGARFKNAQDSLLSYYTYKLNDQGQRISSKAFAAAGDELLRQEEYEYNSRGHLISKTILDARGLPQRIFEFTVDKLGNEMEVRVLNPDKSLILVEEFRITKTDGQDNWVEKWGFVNDQPFSYLAREIVYY